MKLVWDAGTAYSIALRGLLVVVAVGAGFGCASSKFAGNWSGTLKESAEAKKTKTIGYSETKRSLKNSLSLSGDGSYTAKFQEVDYTGDWKQSGSKITLTPTTFMGMTQDKFPKTKKEVGVASIETIFKPYELEVGSDEKSLSHSGPEGSITFTKQD